MAKHETNVVLYVSSDDRIPQPGDAVLITEAASRSSWCMFRGTIVAVFDALADVSVRDDLVRPVASHAARTCTVRSTCAFSDDHNPVYAYLDGSPLLDDIRYHIVEDDVEDEEAVAAPEEPTAAEELAAASPERRERIIAIVQRFHDQAHQLYAHSLAMLDEFGLRLPQRHRIVSVQMAAVIEDLRDFRQQLASHPSVLNYPESMAALLSKLDAIIEWPAPGSSDDADPTDGPPR
ncbi:MAG: hypothetical protein Q7S96_05120 [bacterium]|nr:hypothetical protein [bacterium]